MVGLYAGTVTYIWPKRTAEAIIPPPQPEKIFTTLKVRPDKHIFGKRKNCRGLQHGTRELGRIGDHGYDERLKEREKSASSNLFTHPSH